MSSDRCTTAQPHNKNLCATSQWGLSAIERGYFSNCCAWRPFSFCLLHPLFSSVCPPSARPPLMPPAASSSTLGFDVNCPIISHWPRRGSGGVWSTGVDVYIYTLYGARFQPTAMTHKAKKRSHFLAPLRKQRKDHGSNRVVQSGSWTLNHNKHFFLTRRAENRGWGVVGWPAGKLVWCVQAEREVDTNRKWTRKSACPHNFLCLRWKSSLDWSAKEVIVSPTLVSCRKTTTQWLL